MQLNEEEFWRITLREFDALLVEWQNAQKRLDYRTGLICATMANLQRDTKKHPKPFKAEDFMPKSAVKKPAQDWQSMKAQTMAIHKAITGKKAD